MSSEPQYSVDAAVQPPGPLPDNELDAPQPLPADTRPSEIPTTPQPNIAPHRGYSWPTRFLLKIVGVDEQLVPFCPIRELHLHLTTAIAIVTTSCLAGCSGYLVLSTIFGRPSIWTALLAVLWAFIVLNIDRTIVLSSYASEDSYAEVATIKRRIVPILIRIPIALALAIVIAVPIELTIFSPEISQAVAAQNRSEVLVNARTRKEEADSRLSIVRKDLADATERLRTLEHQREQDKDELLKESRQRDVHYQIMTDSDGLRHTEQTKSMTPTYFHLKEQLAATEVRMNEAEKLRDMCAERVREAERIRNQLFEDVRREEATASTAAMAGLATRFATMQAIKASNREWGRLALAIVLLFIMIETIPALSRAIGATPVYDELVNSRTRRPEGTKNASLWRGNLV